MVSVDDTEMRAVLDRLTRLEERGVSRAQIVDAQLSHVDERMARMETAITKLVASVETLSDDVKAAKTGFRVGLWISTTVIPAASGAIGWFAHHLAGK